MDAAFKINNRSVGHGKQCVLVFECVEDGLIMRWALQFEVEHQRKKEGPNGTWKR